MINEIESRKAREELVTQVCEKLTTEADISTLQDFWYNNHFEMYHAGDDTKLLDIALQLELITIDQAQNINRDGF